MKKLEEIELQALPEESSLFEVYQSILNMKLEDLDHLFTKLEQDKPHKIISEGPTLQDEQLTGTKSELDLEGLNGNQIIKLINGDDFSHDDKMKDEKQNDQEKKTDDFAGVFSQVEIKIQKNNNYPKHISKHVIQRASVYGKKFFGVSQKIQKEINTFITKEKKMYKKQKNWNNNLQSMKKIFGHCQKSSNPQLRSQLIRKMTHQLIIDEIIPEIKRNRQISKLRKSYLFTSKIQLFRSRNVDLMNRVENH